MTDMSISIAGVGRTGTIVACYLAEQMENPTADSALAKLRSLFSAMPKSAQPPFDVTNILLPEQFDE